MIVPGVTASTEEESVLIVAAVELRSSPTEDVNVGSIVERVNVVAFGENVMVIMFSVLTSGFCVLSGDPVTVVVCVSSTVTVVVDVTGGVVEEETG